jgi:hypothetical protein
MLKTMNLPMSEMPAAQAFLLEEGAADAIVLWAPEWAALQPAENGPYDLVQLTDLDLWSKWVLEHGKKLLIAVPCAYPPWSYGARSKKYGTVDTLPPDDLHPQGAWARYLQLLFFRYPGATLIALNEPDYAFSKDPDAGLHTAQMMMCAADVAARCRHERILGPATATSAFAERVLRWLHNWKPPVRVGWAHHQYRDVDAGDTREVATVLHLLEKHHWRDGKKIWLTEGGYIYKTTQSADPDYHADPATWSYADPLALQELRQHCSVSHHYHWSRDLRAAQGVVECWANYEYVDAMWGGWASGLVRHDGTPHPLRDDWVSW